MESDDEEVGKETFVLEETEICGDVVEKESDVCVQEMENAFSWERHPCVASVGRGYGYVSS